MPQIDGAHIVRHTLNTALPFPCGEACLTDENPEQIIRETKPREVKQGLVSGKPEAYRTVSGKPLKIHRESTEQTKHPQKPRLKNPTHLVK